MAALKLQPAKPAVAVKVVVAAHAQPAGRIGTKGIFDF
jgi:hypothetical protein